MELAPIDHNGAKTGPYIVIRGVKGGVCGGGRVVWCVVYGVSCGEMCWGVVSYGRCGNIIPPFQHREYLIPPAGARRQNWGEKCV